MILVYTQRHPRGYQFSWKPRAWHWFHISKPSLEADGSRWSLLKMGQLSHRQQGLTELLGAGATDVFFFLLPMCTTRCAWLRFCRDRWGSLLLITLKVHYHGLLQFYGWKKTKQNNLSNVCYCPLYITYIYYFFFTIWWIWYILITWPLLHAITVGEVVGWDLTPSLSSGSEPCSCWPVAAFVGLCDNQLGSGGPTVMLELPPSQLVANGFPLAEVALAPLLVQVMGLVSSSEPPSFCTRNQYHVKINARKKYKRNAGSKWKSAMCQLLAPRQSSCILMNLFK